VDIVGWMAERCQEWPSRGSLTLIPDTADRAASEHPRPPQKARGRPGHPRTTPNEGSMHLNKAVDAAGQKQRSIDSGNRFASESVPSAQDDRGKSCVGAPEGAPFQTDPDISGSRKKRSSFPQTLNPLSSPPESF